MKFVTTRLLVTASLLALLAACSTSLPRPSVPAPPAPAVIRTPTTAATTVTAQPDLWTRMRARFVMPDCDADPAISAWAKRFTHQPRRFEAYLDHVAPTIAYVEQSASKAGIPAEFTLLPWVESRYRAVTAHARGAAGMWQIVPITARTLRLPQQFDYDARLDRIVTTPAVMALLKSYHQRWQDWRLVDMAYNAGEYRIRHLHASGPAPSTPAIPSLAVAHTTRQHLIKLLAMACVIRHPARFHVRLPTLVETRRLQAVTLPTPVTLEAIARTTRMPLQQVHALNAGYLHGRMPSDGPWHVLLPAAQAQQLRTALITGTLPQHLATYNVVAGDTLWGIARHYGISVAHLRELNNLQKTPLQPGQVLRIDDVN